jgi:hypothetical protein
MRCFRRYWLLTLASRLFFGLTSASREQLQQQVTFSELFEIINIQLDCQLLFSVKRLTSPLNLRKEVNNNSHSAKYQNIMTLKNERGALSSFTSCFNCSGLGLDCR